MNNNGLKKLALGALLVVVVLALGTALGLRSNLASSQPADEQGVSQFTLVKADVVSALMGSRAQAASVTIDLCASDGTITLPDGTMVPVWSFVDTGGGACMPGLVTSLPGPMLQVVAGDSVTINLSNALTVPTSILIPGQSLSATGGAAGTFTQEAAPGGMVVYTFTAQEGSFLYESGTSADVQVAMGLYGALVVESFAPGLAYGYAFDQEAVLVLSEIDPMLNANPAGFNMQDYKPVYWLINGQAYPDTTPIVANAGEKVLLRYLNAGFDNLSMSLLGGLQTLIAKNGFEIPFPYNVIAETVAAGQTMEMIVDTTGLSGSLAIFNRNLYLTNGNPGLGHSPGGMLTFLDVQATIGNPPAVSIVSPADASTVSGASFLVQISASDVEDDITPGPGSLTVEWRADGNAWQSAFYNGVSGFYEASWDTTTLAEGPVTFEARATDSDANTTTTAQFTVTVDNVDDAPVVNIFNPMDGEFVTGSILIEANASDDHNVAQVEFFDGATSLGVDMDGSDGWSVLWITAGDGAHTLEARATDDGVPANESSDFINVTVDNTAPSVSITAPADGATVSGPVTIMASASDATSGVLQVEFFVDGGSIGVDANSGDGWSADWDTSDLNAGPYSLTATAINGAGLSASDTISVNVDNPAQSTLHVGDLDAATSIQNQDQPNERWTATVTVSVHDATEAPVSGALVAFEVAWINKNNGNTQTASLSCTTGANGQCQVSREFMSSNTEDIVSFTVTGITHVLTYEPLDNHDPDPDQGPDVVDNLYSDGTTIQVEVVRP